jgi:hypothetical protein
MLSPNVARNIQYARLASVLFLIDLSPNHISIFIRPRIFPFHPFLSLVSRAYRSALNKEGYKD